MPPKIRKLLQKRSLTAVMRSIARLRGEEDEWLKRFPA